MSTPAPAAPPAPRKGLHLPVWVVAVIGVVVALVVLLIIGRAIRHHDGRSIGGGRFGPGGFDGRGFDGRHGVDHPFIWLLVGIALVTLVVVGVVALVRRSSSSRTAPVAPVALAPTASGSAEEVLAQRFARGEIDEAEFRARRDTLRS